jgi:hypothetical protein
MEHALFEEAVDVGLPPWDSWGTNASAHDRTVQLRVLGAVTGGDLDVEAALLVVHHHHVGYVGQPCRESHRPKILHRVRLDLDNEEPIVAVGYMSWLGRLVKFLIYALVNFILFFTFSSLQK